MKATKFLLFGLLVLAMSGCMFGGFITADDKVEKDFQTTAAPTVIIETFNGNISVQGNNSSDVHVEITRRGSGMSDAEARADLENILVETQQDGNTIHITIRRSDMRSGNSGASVEVRLPGNANLELASSNGSITVEDVQGSARMASSNGNLTVTGGSGTLNMDTSNGRIEIDAENASVNANTSNGNISFSGSLANGVNTFNSSNARIELTLSAASSFTLNATTSNGNITSGFAVTGGSQGDNYLNGSVGTDPQIQVNITTSNGNISINKK